MDRDGTRFSPAENQVNGSWRCLSCQCDLPDYSRVRECQRDGHAEHGLTDGMIETFLEYGKSIPPGTKIAIPHLGGAMNKRPVDAIAPRVTALGC